MSEFTIDTDFPAANAIIESVETDDVRLRQDQRGSTERWFYWHFRVRHAQSRTLRFTFTDWDVIGTRGPAVSRDGGRTYTWLGRATVNGPSFTYTFGKDEEETFFAFCLPYLQRHLDMFLGRFEDSPHLRRDSLCLSGKGRAVERLHVGRLDKAAPIRVAVTCRHHACESSASYAAEGMMEAILAGREGSSGAWLRENVECLFIPFVDKDGVEDGDQGKLRGGRDHNRDYGGQSIYPETAAIRRFLPAFSDGHLRVALDLHCPWIRGRHNEDVYLVGSSDPAIWARQQRFGALLEEVACGDLPYHAADNLPFGTDWNVRRGNELSFGRWAASLPGMDMTSTIEIPYATVHEAIVTPDNLRALGRDLVAALHRYLAEPA